MPFAQSSDCLACYRAGAIGPTRLRYYDGVRRIARNEIRILSRIRTYFFFASLNNGVPASVKSTTSSPVRVLMS